MELRIAALGAMDGVVLALRFPDWTRLAHELGSLPTTVATDGADPVIARFAWGLLWLCGAWLFVGMLASVSAERQDALGLSARWLVQVGFPRRIRTGLISLTGAGLAFAPVLTPGGPAHHHAVLVSVATPASTGPEAGWPTSPTHQTPATTQASSTPPTAAKPAPTQPSSTRPTTAKSVTTRSTSARPADPSATSLALPISSALTTAPHTTAPHTAAPHTATPPAAGATGTPTQPPPDRQQHGRQKTAPVTVRDGDTLWHIAAEVLGPGATPAQIADAWPGWYAANRRVIGDDPDLIRPGQVLRRPTTPTNRTPR